MYVHSSPGLVGWFPNHAIQYGGYNVFVDAGAFLVHGG